MLKFDILEWTGWGSAFAIWLGGWFVAQTEALPMQQSDYISAGSQLTALGVIITLIIYDAFVKQPRNEKDRRDERDKMQELHFKERTEWREDTLKMFEEVSKDFADELSKERDTLKEMIQQVSCKGKA